MCNRWECSTQLSHELRKQQHCSQYTFVHLKMEVKVLTQGSLDWTQEEDERIVWLFHTALISSTQQSDFWVSNLSIFFNSSNNTFAWCLAQVQNDFFFILLSSYNFFFFALEGKLYYVLYTSSYFISKDQKQYICWKRSNRVHFGQRFFPQTTQYYIYRERFMYLHIEISTVKCIHFKFIKNIKIFFIL